MVFPLSNIVEIINSRRISSRLILAIIEPMIVDQFLNVGGNFIIEIFLESGGVNIEKYWGNLSRKSNIYTTGLFSSSS